MSVKDINELGDQILNSSIDDKPDCGGVKE